MADERIGPYRILHRLGAGGMGEVVLAHDDRLDRLVAIKRLLDDQATPDRRERFRREARIAARLHHPAIVQIYDVFHRDDHDYLIMEYVAGTTLRARCNAAPLSVPELVGIAHQIALGMVAAHDLGVVHRDLKPENVLLTRTGRAKITDFGIAKIHGEDSITSDGAVVGTFHAMSPEQALGRATDHRSDLFSFGILLYECLAGESPFHAESPFLTVQRLVADDPRPIRELVPAVPQALANLIHQLLAKEPVLRPRNFHEVADALIELAGHACDTPCAGAPGNSSPATGEDQRPTDDSLASAHPAFPDGRERARRGAVHPHDNRARRDSLHARIASSPSAASAAAAAPGSAPHAAPGTADGIATGLKRAHTGRPRLRGNVTAVAIAIVIMGAVSANHVMRGRHAGEPPPAPHISVAVLAPSVAGAEARPAIALLAAAVRNAIIAGVRNRTGLDLVPRADIDSYVDGVVRGTGQQPLQHAIRTAVGADEVIATRIECLLDSCTITLERDGAAAGGPPPASFQLAAISASRPDDTVIAHLSRLYPDHPVRGATTGSLDPQDHERFVQLVNDYWTGNNTVSTDELLAELAGMRARAPQFLDALLFEAEVCRHRYLETEDPDEAQRAIQLLQDADHLFPETYDILSARFDVVLSASRLDEADALLGRLTTLDPDSSATHLQRAKLHYKRGDLTQASTELDAATRRDSFPWRALYLRAQLAKRLGDRAGTRRAIGEFLARSPGNYTGLSMLAFEHLSAGRLACAEQIYADLVARKPLFGECNNLGATRTLLGRYREAVDSFHCALAIRPADLNAQFNLGEALLLAGDTSSAHAQLHIVHHSFERKRQSSPDGALRGNDRHAEAMTLAYLGGDDPMLAAEARSRVEQLITPSAGSAALYTASVVHGFLGDRALAASYVTRYLDAGGSPASLQLPWFDDLRRDPVLGPRLVRPSDSGPCETGASH